MMRRELPLPGCTPEPLMSYLKALGILRLVAEQADPAARGCWHDGVFVLNSTLDEEALTGFFLTRYSPSPIVAPWGARSGFYAGSSEKKAREALSAIEAQNEDRFVAFKGVVDEVRQLLERLGLTEKAEEEEKLRLLAGCRSVLDESTLQWLDACYVLTGDERRFPPIFGTGGNEGSGSYVSGFAQQVVACLVKRSHDEALKVALFGGVAKGASSGQTPGHFSPRDAGGPNATQGFEGSVTTNPWDYLLAIEGACMWASGVFRKHGTTGRQVAAFPFTVQVSAAGASSLGMNDNRRPKQAKRDIAEMWLPIWHRPTGVGELSALLAEGRASVGRRPAETGLDFARSASGLGTDRGINEFVRIGFLMRNGQSFMGISLGHHQAAILREAHLLCKIDPWLRAFHLACGEKTPARFTFALRGIERTIFDFCRHGGGQFFQGVLVALGKAEAVIAGAPGFREKAKGLRPLAGLSAEWIVAANDESPEFEIALALASLHDASERTPPIRANLEPVVFDRSRPAWAEKDRAVVWNAAGLAANLAAVLGRRLMDANRAGSYGVEHPRQRQIGPLAASHHVSLPAITRFLAAELDDERIHDLLRGLMLCDVHHASCRFENDTEMLPPRAYALLKLLFLSFKLATENGDVFVPPDPALLAVLRSRNVDEAWLMAGRKLRAKGFIPMPQQKNAGHRRAQENENGRDREFAALDATRVAAALLLPVSPNSALKLRDLVIRPPKPNNP